MKRIVMLCAFFLFLVQVAIAGVNINTADQATLESLPGIGPAKASAIIQYRANHGNFSSVAELTRVKGIGQKLLAKFKDQIEVE